MGAERSWPVGGAGRVTEQVSLARRVGDGIAESTREERQTGPARGEITQEGTRGLLEEALRRENVVRATFTALGLVSFLGELQRLQTTS